MQAVTPVSGAGPRYFAARRFPDPVPAAGETLVKGRGTRQRRELA